MKLADGYYLYNGPGEEGDDELAMKAAGLELRAAVQCSKVLGDEYNVPMQSLIDFQGFRIVHNGSRNNLTEDRMPCQFSP